MTGSMRVMTMDPVMFHFGKSESVSGKFSLSLYRDEYCFEWVPESVDVANGDELTLDQFCVLVRLCELSSIHTDESRDGVSMSMVTKGQQETPAFVFKCFPALVTHLLEFLESKGLVAKILGVQSSGYSVHVPFTSIDHHGEQRLYLSPSEVVALSRHKELLEEMTRIDITMDENPVTLEEAKSFFDANGVCRDFVGLKKAAFIRGLDDQARNMLWPYFIGARDHSRTSRENENDQTKRLEQYKVLKGRWQSFIDEQKSRVRTVMELLRVVDSDVKRNERSLPQFAEWGNPYLVTLNDVLVTYGVYNKDCGYVQGMGDLISPILVLYVAKWTDDTHAVLWNGQEEEKIAVESTMFWMLVHMLEILQQDRLFTDMVHNQRFVLERVYEIITKAHGPLRRWLNGTENASLFFVFRPLLLVYKRDFKRHVVLRIWDSLFAAEMPYAFIRHFTAAVVFLLYPKFLLNKAQSSGEVLQTADDRITTLDGVTVLRIATSLWKNTVSDSSREWEIQEIPNTNILRDYVPLLFKPA